MQIKLSALLKKENHELGKAAPNSPNVYEMVFCIEAEKPEDKDRLFALLKSSNIPSEEFSKGMNRFTIPGNKCVSVEKEIRNPLMEFSVKSFSYAEINFLEASLIKFEDFKMLWERFTDSTPEKTINKLINAIVSNKSPATLVQRCAGVAAPASHPVAMRYDPRFLHQRIPSETKPDLPGPRPGPRGPFG